MDQRKETIAILVLCTVVLTVNYFVLKYTTATMLAQTAQESK